MKRKTAWRLVLIGFGVAFATNGAHAQEAPRVRWYARLNADVALLQETALEEFRFAGPGLVDVEGDAVEFEPGFGFGISGGCWLTSWLAVELETGYSVNGIKRLAGDDAADALLAQIPWLANLVYQYPGWDKIKPFVGVGAGGLTTILSVDNDTWVDADGDNAWLDGSQDDTVFAFQGFVGVSYRFTENASVGLRYRFLGAVGPSWDFEYGFRDSGGVMHLAEGEIAFDDLLSHSISAQFTYRF